MRNIRFILVRGAIAAAFAAAVPLAFAADAAYPTKPVRLIMGPAAGGPTDATGRVITTRLSELWKQPVVIENRPGAGNTIASTAVAKSTPDGYTLLFCTISDSFAPALYRKLPYDFSKEIAPIAEVGSTPNIVVVPPSSPAKNLKEFIALAKANPGKLNYGGTGIGQSGHLSMELFQMMTGTKIVYVPYKTVGLAITDILAGRIDVQSTNLPAHIDNVRAGKVRALGVTSAKRSLRLPDVPAIAETLPGFDMTIWFGMCSPSGVPRPIVSKIAADIHETLKIPEIQKRLDGLGVEIEFKGPEEFATYIKAETGKWAKVVKTSGIQGQQ